MRPFVSGRHEVATSCVPEQKLRMVQFNVAHDSERSPELASRGAQPRSRQTDLGEYILQLADERPYHIIAPALHYTRHDVARIFEKKLGRNETEPSDQAMIARGVLRQKFLDADIGITAQTSWSRILARSLWSRTKATRG